MVLDRVHTPSIYLSIYIHIHTMYVCTYVYIYILTNSLNLYDPRGPPKPRDVGAPGTPLAAGVLVDCVLIISRSKLYKTVRNYRAPGLCI